MNQTIVATGPWGSNQEESLRQHFKRTEENALPGNLCRNSNSICREASPQPKEIRLMLSWYRSRDMRKVAAAAEWFIAIDVKERIETLVGQLDHDDPFCVDEAKESLSAFGELALKRVIRIFDDPSHCHDAMEILADMESSVVPHLVRTLKTTRSFEVTTRVLEALTKHLDHPEARSSIRESLRDPDSMVAAFVCQSLLERGPRGNQFLAQVFPQKESLAA